MTEPPLPPDRPTPGDPYQPPSAPYPSQPAYPQYGGWGEPLAGPGNPPAGYSPPPPRGARLGARLLQRPVPRFSIVVAGAGAAVLLVGALVWASGYWGEGLDVRFDDTGLRSTGGGSRRFLGVVLFLGITAGGHATAIVRRRGPLATAGAVAAAFGLPALLAFLTLDAGDLFRGRYPFNVDLVFVLSIAAWLVDYFLVPGLRGRSLFLGAAAIWLFGYVSLKASGDSVLGVRNSAFGGGDAGAIAAAGLIFGLTYYAIAAVLDRQGRRGAAVALVVAGFDATVGGIAAGANDMGTAGTGALLVVLGAGLSWYGAYFERRFTAWAWGAGVGLGIVLIVGDIFTDSYIGGGITLMVVGLLVVVAAYGLATATHEAPDVEEAPAPQPVG